MPSALLVQLPITQLNYGRQAGNVPLAAALLKQARNEGTEILPESRATYIGDEALIELIVQARADVVGFTVYCWNMERTLYLAKRLKEAYAPRIVLGGPEITPDNEAIRSPHVDFLVFGEGEAVFRELMTNEAFWELGSASMPSDEFFINGRSPYQDGLLEPEIENVVLLETQRGCPYGCAYCYYPKDRSRIGRKEESPLLDSVRWAVESGFPEIYLLDPSLDSRPNLKGLLKDLAQINKDGNSVFISEIRAEPIDEPLPTCSRKPVSAGLKSASRPSTSRLWIS